MKRRTPQSRHGLKRRGPVRQAYDKVLIVTEGRKTEVAYFKGLIREHGLSNINIEVVGLGAGPKMVVDEALNRKRTEVNRGDAYDHVYCVFDFDRHPSFASASDRAWANGLSLARSWPCFEYWFLLHFQYSRRPYTSDGNRSACELCIEDLKVHVPEYNKAFKNLYAVFKNHVELAKDHAKQAREDAKGTEIDNPSTEIDLLVERIQLLAERNDVDRSQRSD